MERLRCSRRRPGSFLLLAAAFLAAAAVSSANIGEFDDHWQKRKEEAEASARETYKPNPFNVTNNLNGDVHRHAPASSPRRGLGAKKSKFAGPCRATNPIDRCWRCRQDWATDRKRLARCAKGFGHAATGGLRGKIYLVTDPTDDDMVNPRPGTLRWGAIQTDPLWITFARSMIIRLSQELLVNSDKTIDGRGAQVHIANGAGITVQFARNVIIHNLHIHDVKHSLGGLMRDSPTHLGPRTRADGDAISLFGATNVWIDHISMSNCEDGLVDVVQSSTGITISNGHLTNHNDVMLFGASDSYPQDQVMQITVAFNHFGRGLVQRMPRCRWGFFHVVNNDYTHWLMYAIGGSNNPTIISQGNRYIAPPNIAAKVITKHYAEEQVWKNWVWHSEDDLLMNGAIFMPSGGAVPRKIKDDDWIRPKPGSYVKRLTRFAGALSCSPGKPC
ncbi:pectate lyase-like [Phragmites australis]|uniref:pectate lyase-like n=1 Tax=Phragmites australis TaxID=29695 RepID=UPI002D769671|nr:pectate lyase-like [Phragmites australis]